MPTTPRIGARVLLLDDTDHVLLIHALDPVGLVRWWELPGGGLDDGEDLVHGADTQRGMALACRCATDRHHRLKVDQTCAADGQVTVRRS